MDARWGDIQYAMRNDKKIPIPGAQGWAGMFSMIATRLSKDKGYNPILLGNSYIQVISWDKDGRLQPTGILTYSQSQEPESAHYADLTELYSREPESAHMDRLSVYRRADSCRPQSDSTDTDRAI